jgi:glycerol uptake operon antiterminator
MRTRLLDLIHENPSIAGIKDPDGLRLVLKSDCRIVFILYGTVMTITAIVQKLKEHGKMVFINVDLIDGFSSREVVLEFLKQHTQVDGILSSKAAMIKAAKALGLFTIHRFFLIDSFSYHNLAKQVELSKPDCIEIMPGCMPKVLGWVVESISIPVVAGGLVCDQDDAEAALKAGATAVSSTNPVVWSLRSGTGAPPPGEAKAAPAQKSRNIFIDSPKIPS